MISSFRREHRRGCSMMEGSIRDQEQLFYSFNLDEVVPDDPSGPRHSSASKSTGGRFSNLTSATKSASSRHCTHVALTSASDPRADQRDCKKSSGSCRKPDRRDREFVCGPARQAIDPDLQLAGLITPPLRRRTLRPEPISRFRWRSACQTPPMSRKAFRRRVRRCEH